jgi:signal peptidase I
MTESKNNDFQPGHQCDFDIWFPVCIAYIIPGFGHLWIQKYMRGAAYFVGGVAINLFFILCLVSSQCPFPILFFMLSVSACYPFLVSYLTYVNVKQFYKVDISKEKKCWLAIYLNMLIPGIGNLYLRRWYSSVVFFLWFMWIGMSMPLKVSRPLLLIVRIASLLYIYLSFGPLQSKLIIMIFCIYFAGVTVINKHVISQFNHKYIYEIATIDGNSMAPDIFTRDVVVINKLAYVHNNKPKVGDIILFYFNKGGIGVVKRIVAVEKENVTITGRSLFADGKLRKIYEADLSTVQGFKLSEVRYINNYMVPNDHYYVVGDNVSKSESDSRSAGAISRNKIVGRITKIIWNPYRLTCFRGN